MKKFFIFTLLINLCLLGSAKAKDCLFSPQKSQVKHYSLGYFYCMENQEEIWKDVVGYEGLYKVSNIGEVKRVLSKNFIYSKYNKVVIEGTLVPQNYVGGYLRLSLRKNNKDKQFSAHRLVCEAFLPNLEGKPFVNHKDGIRDNNRVENLEWCTTSENALHCIRILGKAKPRIGSKNSMAKKVFEYSKEGNLLNIWGSVSELPYDKGAISSCCRGCVKSIYGKIFSYKELSAEYFIGLKIGKAEPKMKSVSQIDKNAKVIKIYSSLESVRQDGFDPDYVSKCARGINRMHKGFYWSFDQVEEIKKVA